MHEFKRS